MARRALLAALFLVASLFGPAHGAGIPHAINYQGHLTSAGGAPVNATLSIIFALYDGPSGGSALWAETQASVTVTNGVFNVTLGSVNSMSGLAFDVPYYLGVSVGADAEMVPRTALSSSPYSLRTLKAESVVDGSITGSSIQNNTIGPQKLSGGGICLAGYVLRYTGSAWECVQQYAGSLAPAPANESFLTYSTTSGQLWRNARPVCAPVNEIFNLPNLSTTYVNPICPADRYPTGAYFSEGAKLGSTISVGIDGASCYFTNSTGSSVFVGCAVICCKIGF